MKSIADKLHSLRERMTSIALAAGREPEEVKLLAVSKTFTASQVQLAADAGQKSFGENYLQDALPKMQALPQLEWHFIGAIQSNKTQAIAAHFNWVHTLASVKAARRLHEQREGGPINSLIQVNISAETAKSGVGVGELKALVESILGFERISLRGLMAIPAEMQAEDEQRKTFAKLRELRDSIQAEFQLTDFTELSMGMSHDFEAAIMEGATWIRLGTAIFGLRN